METVHLVMALQAKQVMKHLMGSVACVVMRPVARSAAIEMLSREAYARIAGLSHIRVKVGEMWTQQMRDLPEWDTSMPSCPYSSMSGAW